MAETVVSMARSMVRGAIRVAASAAAAEVGLLVGVRKDIWFIKDELETMEAFLEVAESINKKDVLLKVWAKQVRDLSYNIEDCLSDFMVHVGSQSLLRRLMKLKDRHRIAIQIRDLKTRVEEVSIRNTRYNLIKAAASNTIGDMDSHMEDVRNHSASNIDEAELVGFSKPKKELIKLMDVKTEDGTAKVVFVVGMGGLGKTTLARKAFESKEDIVNKFSCRAWITVSQTFSKIEMLKDMIMQLFGNEELKKRLKELEGKTVQVDDLASYLREMLQEKRYFIVLDDLWTTDAWGWIKDIAFPATNIKGSRIIVTTRDIGLAQQCTSKSLIYHLKHLQIDQATNLLLKKIGKTHTETESDERMRNVISKIVNKCGGLPLAILTIGGLLA
uniref:Disease resistance protein RPM1 n=4 Tax=Triticum TaxID=4564 RepID=A0A8R7QUZ1_TRIUA